MNTRINNTNSTILPPRTIPASIILPWKIRVDVTIFFVVLHGLLFLGIAYQLLLIFYYRYKKFAYRTIFVALCLVWALLRVIMFGFYFDPAVCTVAFDLPVITYWLLYALPVCLQFATLSLFAHYYIQVVHKSGRDTSGACCSCSRFFSLPRWALNATWGFFFAIFVAVNTACVVFTYYNYNALRKQDAGIMPPGMNSPHVFPILRIGVTEGFFLLVAVTISLCIVKIARSAELRQVLDGEGMPAFQWTAIVLVLLFLSRAIFNIVAIKMKLKSSGRDWPIVSDEVDYGGDIGTAYIIFGIVLFVWEYLPTVTVIVHFRVKKPSRLSMENAPSLPSQSYFQKNSERRPLLIPSSSLLSSEPPTGSYSAFHSSFSSSLASAHSINA